MSPANDTNPSTPSHHPDLSNEIATLSNKLINAINHQTNLDDTLSATRHELESSKERIRQLERETQDYKDLISRGILIRKSISELEKSKLSASLAEERRQREEAEKAKKKMEGEVEALTTALFEEANKVCSTICRPIQIANFSVDGCHSSRKGSRRARHTSAQKRSTESTTRGY
jgi:Rab guanine nucleotide exchange factor SEC2